ncbi:hypothetical protein [Emticicia sp.]|uniref:hypothetical protein n=1 Tax=Emticicia sp. TaxID=1930953 RepID=UPI00375036AA
MSFKTITLRNLDSKENKEVVKILESFMFQRDIKTGQTAIEEIIKEYDYQKKLAEKQSNLLAEMQNNYNQKIDDLRSQNESLKLPIGLFRNFTESIKNVKL